MLRWTWGYNVLLAPLDNVEGTADDTDSNLENGDDEDPEERESLINHSRNYEEGEDSYTSGSEETQVEVGDSLPRRFVSVQDTSKFPSGAQTPITYQQHTLSSSSSKSTFPAALEGSQDPPHFTPEAEDYDTSHHSRCQQAGEETFILARILEIRIKSTITGWKATISHMAHHVSQWTTQVALFVFDALPQTAQRALRVFHSGFKRFWLGVWEFMNPPLWAMLAAIIVASIPSLQHLFFAKGTFFKNSVTSAIEQSGGVAVPLILVVLGGNLARNTLPNGLDADGDKHEETKLLIASLLSRMVLPFTVMAPLLALTAKYVPVSILDDPIFIIVCFLITGAPSALQLAQICQINNVYMGAMSRLLFQSYVVWILPSTLVLVMCALEVVEWAKSG